MKLMLIVLLTASAAVTKAQSLTVTIFNKTGYDLDSVSLRKGQYFKIKADEEVKLNNCDSVAFEYGLPFGFPGGVIPGKVKNTQTLRLCGTDVETLVNGDYKIDIIMRSDESGYRLFWYPHEVEVGK